MNITADLLHEAGEAKNAEELIAAAKAEGEELSTEAAEKLDDKALSDDTLDGVSGGII